MNKPRPAILLLASLPFLAVCFSVALWDRVYPMVLGLPFNIFWLIAWMPLTSACLWGAYRLHMSHHRKQEPAQSERDAQ